MLYIGADYYPEQWPEERWEQDAALMKEANFNIARLAEFAWAKLEPEKGRFDFGWLDSAIELLARYGIKTILGTPTATPPKWVMDESPDVYSKDEYGRVRGFGSRRHYCFNSPSYHEHTKRIVTAMALHYKDNKNVIGWQIDNELQGRCFCENCRNAFAVWLQKKYGNVDKMNREWGTAFWSQTYGSFDEIVVPGYTACGVSNGENSVHNPGLELDFKRFSSDSILNFTRFQIELLRQSGCTQPVTHNMMPNAEHADYFNMAKDLDFISWDNYPVSAFDNKSWEWVSMGHSLTRNLKSGSFWVMEQESGPCGWSTLGDTPKPGQLRLWTYQSLAGGADGIVYFRWRAARFGTEQYWYGILDHDGIPRRRYEEIKKTAAEIRNIEDLFISGTVSAPAAVVYSYDILWSHQSQKHNPGFEYKKLISGYYSALVKNNIGADIVGTETDFSKYMLVIMPAFSMMPDGLFEKIQNYVKNGGTLLITFRSGIKTWNGAMTEHTLPGPFKKMAGMELEEFDSLNYGRKVKISGNGLDSEASVWCDILKPITAEPIASYSEEYYKGKPAITVNRYGNGLVYYVGCDLDTVNMQLCLDKICKSSGIKPTLAKPAGGVETVNRNSASGKFTVVLNHNSFPVSIGIENDSVDLLTHMKVKNEITLAPFGVAVLYPEK